MLTVWELGVRTGGISSLFFPAPSVIVQTTLRLLAGGQLLGNLGVTLLRVLLGFSLGSISGVILGLLLGRSCRLRSALDPLIAAAHPIPKLAIFPLVMILFGIGEISKVIIVAVAAFFPMVINTMAGVHQIHPIHFEVAKNYGASNIKIFTRVVIPGGLPFILTGVRLALNLALTITIAVELVAAERGLGAMIWLAWQTLRTEELYSSIAVTACLGLSFSGLLRWTTTRLIPWQAKEST
jgi:ABC-type nitrate/sulfonate/bicarbonate transport system permease component